MGRTVGDISNKYPILQFVVIAEKDRALRHLGGTELDRSKIL